jgi:hypothetical protein
LRLGKKQLAALQNQPSEEASQIDAKLAPVPPQHNEVPYFAPRDPLAATLADRKAKYGPFSSQSHISQDLKEVMWGTVGWCNLAADQREGLEMLQHKIARILNGDPNYIDSWIDIAGYARLISDRLEIF